LLPFFFLNVGLLTHSMILKKIYEKNQF